MLNAAHEMGISVCCFFFKQKTAYEMRISDWSSDVCSSDLSIGAPGHTVAEVVFNTAMTGYQEILTDPSYNGQIVTLTYPHIGNTGVNTEDVETARVLASGLVVRDCPSRVSNFRATQRSDERRGGTEGVRTGGIRWWP